MKSHIVLYESAQEDIIQIYQYYAGISELTAHRFLDAMNNMWDQLLLFPFIGSLRYTFATELADVRFFRLADFPYIIFYKVDEGLIVIIRCIHARTDILAAFGALQTPLD